MEIDQLTPQDIDRMRAILAQHDASSNGLKMVKEFDLNNPPKEPYTHKPFPKVVYDHDTRTHIVVRDAKQHEAALARGYSNEPYPAEVEDTELELDPEDLAEIKALEEKARARAAEKNAAESKRRPRARRAE